MKFTGRKYFDRVVNLCQNRNMLGGLVQRFIGKIMCTRRSGPPGVVSLYVSGLNTRFYRCVYTSSIKDHTLPRFSTFFRIEIKIELLT